MVSKSWQTLYILTIIIFIFGTVNYLMPLVEQRKANEKVIVALDSQTDPLSRETQIRQIRLQTEKLSQRSRELDKAIPSRMGNAEMIRQISEAALRHGLYQKSIKENLEAPNLDEKDIGPKNLRSTLLVWSGSGGQQEFMSFLEEIESSVRLCQITDIMMSRRADEAEPQEPEAHFNITFHLRSFCYQITP